jgi:hypothetical protein
MARRNAESRALRVTCPKCGAKPRYSCRSVVAGSREYLKHPHKERVTAGSGVPEPVTVTYRDGTEGTITVPTADEVAARDGWIAGQAEKLRREFGDWDLTGTVNPFTRRRP